MYVGKTEVPMARMLMWPWSTGLLHTRSDVTLSLLSRHTLTHLLAVSHYGQCCCIKTSTHCSVRVVDCGLAGCGCDSSAWPALGWIKFCEISENKWKSFHCQCSFVIFQSPWIHGELFQSWNLIVLQCTRHKLSKALEDFRYEYSLLKMIMIFRKMNLISRVFLPTVRKLDFY